MSILNKLAVQMFTLREHTKSSTDFANALAKIAKMGYKAVQLSAVGCMNGDNPAVNAKQARKMLHDQGIRCIATHRPWPNLMEKLDEEIEFHQTLGCDYIAIGGIPGDYGHHYDGYRSWLSDAEGVIQALKKVGIRFGHHNHSHEFARPTMHGPTLEDVIIEESNEDLMLELDLYWIIHAGASPETILKRCKGRVPVVHIKDKEILEGNDSSICAIGEGTMDWPNIFKTGDACGVDWWAIEQDVCRRDAFDCLQSSYTYISSLKL